MRIIQRRIFDLFLLIYGIDVHVGARLDDGEISAMIREADEDGNGEISFRGELIIIIIVLFCRESTLHLPTEFQKVVVLY